MRKRKKKQPESKGGSKSAGAFVLGAIMTTLKVTTAAGAVILTAVGAHAGYEAASEKHYFDVTSVTVSGNRLVTKESVLSLVEPLEGKNILEQSLKLLGEKIETDPRIKSVSIQRELPGALTIMIKERQPVAIIKTSAALWLIDGSGAVIEKAPVENDYRLPLITGVKTANGALVSGEILESSQLAPAFMAINELDSYRMLGKGKLKTVDVSQSKSITISFFGSPTKVVATKRRWTDEVSRLLTVDYLLRKKDQKAESVGLMFADKVVVTYKKI